LVLSRGDKFETRVIVTGQHREMLQQMLDAFGVVPLDDMFPETGLVKLMWALGQTSDPKEAVKLLKTNIAGEYLPRTLPQDKICEGAQ